jgi:hypothetical protein
MGGRGRGVVEDEEGAVVELADVLRRWWRDLKRHAEVVIGVCRIQGVVDVAVGRVKLATALRVQWFLLSLVRYIQPVTLYLSIQTAELTSRRKGRWKMSKRRKRGETTRTAGSAGPAPAATDEVL